MTFELVDTAGLCADCSVVQGNGRILDSTVDGFWALVRRHRPKGTVTVVLHSWGGSMENALRLGSAIRSVNARTIVGRAVRRGDAVEIAPGTCNSACTLAFAGGSRRAVPPGSAYGVHGWLPMALIEPSPEDARKPRTLDREAVQRLHADNARYMAYLDRMGVDVRVMMRALQTPYERMNRLSPQDLREFRVVTEDRLVERRPDRPRPALVLEPAGAPPPDRPGRGGPG
jgi:hypothetical protein